MQLGEQRVQSQEELDEIDYLNSQEQKLIEQQRRAEERDALIALGANSDTQEKTNSMLNRINQPAASVHQEQGSPVSIRELKRDAGMALNLALLLLLWL